ERERLSERQLEDLLGTRRERDLPARHLVALADDARNLGTHLFDGDVKGLEHPRCEALLLAQQAEQDVLGADGVVLQRPGFVLCKNDDLTGSLCEPLEHPLTLLPPGGGVHRLPWIRAHVMVPGVVAIRAGGPVFCPFGCMDPPQGAGYFDRSAGKRMTSLI